MKQQWSVLQIAELIKNVPDFPKPGINFKDITPILENSEAFKSLALQLKATVPAGVTKLMAVESRGFILAAAMAQYLDVGVVLVRKRGKLPRPTIKVSYSLEYGEDHLECHVDSLNAGDKVVIVDDVLATGGTARAVEILAAKSGAKILGSCFLLELTGLKGHQKLSYPHSSLLKI